MHFGQRSALLLGRRLMHQACDRARAAQENELLDQGPQRTNAARPCATLGAACGTAIGARAGYARASGIPGRAQGAGARGGEFCPRGLALPRARGRDRRSQFSLCGVIELRLVDEGQQPTFRDWLYPVHMREDHPQ
jgi:hypothetical protein